MIYDHMVKRNGIYYRAGEDVPETKAEEISLPLSDDDITFEEKENKKYTRTEISKLTTAELRELASEIGIEKADELKGIELKAILIERFGL